MPPNRPALQGLKPLLRTADFSEWEAATSQSLGGHRSHLFTPAATFAAAFRWAEAGPLQVLHMQGSGELEMEREQVGGAVLWRPLQGGIRERLNGRELEVHPGQALLIRPGDQLLGRTSRVLEGVSLLLPASWALATGAASASPLLLSSHPVHNRLLRMTTGLLAACGRQDPARAIAAQELLDQLSAAIEAPGSGLLRQTMPERRRWQRVQDANRWIDQHRHLAFSVADLAAAVGCPVRSLQAAFAQELGRSPLAQARLLRLQALRQSLLDPQLKHHSIAVLMGRCGLLACSATSRQYASCYGELPSQTRRRTAQKDRQSKSLRSDSPAVDAAW